jgi:hypothetical protein
MPIFHRALAGVAFSVAALFGGPAWAIDLNGAWATDVSYCGKVFRKQGDRVTFTQLSDLYGGGFVIAGDRVQTQMGNCTMSKNEDGSTIHVSATCTTEIATDQVQFDIKVVDDNTFSKTFPGTSAAVAYHRCTL